MPRVERRISVVSSAALRTRSPTSSKARPASPDAQEKRDERLFGFRDRLGDPERYKLGGYMQPPLGLLAPALLIAVAFYIGWALIQF
jgi:hypothetical protein